MYLKWGKQKVCGVFLTRIKIPTSCQLKNSSVLTEEELFLYSAGSWLLKSKGKRNTIKKKKKNRLTNFLDVKPKVETNSNRAPRGGKLNNNERMWY